MVTDLIEKNRSVIEVYTKHIEVSAQILEQIKRLNVEIKKYDENFKSIEKQFSKLFEEYDMLKLHVERTLKNHDNVTSVRYDNMRYGLTEIKDWQNTFNLKFDKSMENIKNKINFVYLGFVAIVIALLGMFSKFSK